MSGLRGNTCSISSNPDISGIGVRAAVYIQNFLSFVPAIAALRDGKVTFTELESLEAQSTAILITALAILISTVIQAHRDNGITNYHVSIVLNLSWMNNTNMFIYLFLYAFRRAHLTPQQRKDEDRSLNDVEWVATKPLHWWNSWAMKVLKVLCFPVKNKGVKNKTHEIMSHENRNENLEVDQEAGNPGSGVWFQSGGQMKQALWAETKKVLMDPVIIIGSSHLTFMAAIGIWFWSHPSSFGSSDPCFLLEVTIFVLGIEIPLGSEALRIWSILVYSVLLIPLLNLIAPILFFATFLVFKGKSQKHFIESHQVMMGLGVLGLIEAILLIDTEVTLAKNRHLVESGENDWTFGQTLAILVLLVPSRDLLQSIFDHGAQKQRRRLLLSAVNGAQGMVQVLLDLGVDKHDLNALLRNRSQNGDWEMMNLLFKNGANPDEPNKKGETAYILATRHEHQNPIHVFVGQDVYVNKTDIDKQIYLAATLNYTVSIKFLLENHASLEGKNGRKSSALHLAVVEGKNEVVKLLLEHNVDVHVKDDYGDTALLLAAKKGHENVVKLLLEYNADIHAQDTFGQTPLHSAVQSGHRNTAKLLLEHNANVHIRNNKKQTALHFAGSEGHRDITQILFQHNADIHIKDKYGQTALHLAAHNGHQDIVQFLLEQDADIHVKDNNQQTPLHLAAQKGRKSTVELLLNCNADVHIQDENEQTALHLAACEGHQETVNLLLRHKVNVNMIDKDKQTALHLASKKGHLSTVQLLLIYDADVDVKDKNEQTALHLTVPNPFMGFVDEEPQIAKLLLEHNADIHAKDKNEQTILHLATEAGHQDIVELLLQCKADMHVQDKHGKTPLHLAANKGNQILTELFLQHNANMHIKDKEGHTALDLARSRKYQYIVGAFEHHVKKYAHSQR